MDGQLFCCSCQKETTQRLIRLRQEVSRKNTNACGGIHYLPKALETIIDTSGTLLEEIQFKDNLCFRCNRVIPSLEYCNAMYGSNFKRHYGWYIMQRTLDLHHAYSTGRHDAEAETAEIYDTIRRIKMILDERSKYMPKQEEYHQLFKQYEKANRHLQNAIENCVRKEFGFKEIGSAWIGETMLYEIVKSIFPHSVIKRHYRPTWLDKLELDIFLEKEKIAFEYQGVQHFKAVEHWGGQQQLKRQQEHDHRKKKLCREQNIKLVCINYDEPLNASYVKSKLQSML